MNGGHDKAAHNQVAEAMEDNGDLRRISSEAWLSSVQQIVDLAKSVNMLLRKMILWQIIKEMQNRLSWNYLCSSSSHSTTSSAAVRSGGVIDEIRTRPPSPNATTKFEQFCARCQCPILGCRRKSKMCELCTAKITYVSSSDL